MDRTETYRLAEFVHGGLGLGNSLAEIRADWERRFAEPEQIH
ncbi:hypothetical protein [Paenibacillus sp. SN-8-1]